MNHREFAAVIVVGLIISGVAFALELNATGSFASKNLPKLLSTIPFSLQLAGNDYLTIAVVQTSAYPGQGTICAQDSTNGQQQCTTSSANLLVSVGDAVTFTFTAAQGSMFDHFTAGGGAYGTQNPVSATIVQQSNGGVGYVNAYFDVQGQQTSTQLVTAVTTPPGQPAQTATVTQTSTATSTGSTTSGIPSAPTWIWIVIGILAFLVILVIIFSRR